MTQLLLATLALVGGDPRPMPVTLVTEAITRPVHVAAPPGDERVFVVEQHTPRGTGVVHLIRGGELLDEPFLEVSVEPTGSRGALCLAFDPDWHVNGFVYLFYSAPGGDSVVSRFTTCEDDPNRADPTSEHVVIEVEQPDAFHNGGWLGFGPDDMLYASFGDGGPLADPDRRGQDIESLLGTIVRLDPRIDDFPRDDRRNYGIPTDNPFVGSAGLDEIWAWGLREPWRCAFDPVTGDFFIADVGEDDREEVNVEAAGHTGGSNYGWRCFEGTFALFDDPECADASFVDPVHEYDHTDGRCSITGGVVYRGATLPHEAARYFFADHCTGEIWSFAYVDGAAADLRAAMPTIDGAPFDVGRITSFGVDGCGEMWIAALDDAAGGQLLRVGDATGCTCIADVTDDGAVDVSDLVTLLGAWGQIDHPADLDGDGVVATGDLVLILANWGACF